MIKIKQYFYNVCYAVKIICAASKKYFILKVVITFISALLPYFPLFLWRELINNLTMAIGGNTEPFLKTIWVLAFCYVIVILMEKILGTVSDFIFFKYNDAIQYYLDNLMIDKVAFIDLAFFDSSDLKDKLNNSWGLIYSMKEMVSFVFDMFQKSIRLIISFFLMATLNYRLVPVIIALCIPSAIGDKKSKKMNYEFKKEHAKSRRKLEYYKDLFSGGARQEVRLYNLTDYFTLLYDNVWYYWNNAVRAKDIKVCLINIGTLLILTVSEIIVYILSVLRLIAGEIGVGDISYYVSLLTQFRSDFISLCRKINSFDKHSKEISDVKEFIEMEPMLEKSGTLIPGNHPIIEFRDVSFSYPSSNHEVLCNCSFTLKYGETVGLVGMNGSGKSTIVKLLCRFYDPTSGNILIDGVDIKEYDIVKCRELFGVLFQDYVKYSFSLRENVALSDLSRINESGAILKACAESKVIDFVKEWKNGVDENLTRQFDRNGKELSGGQWQRIALARAFFRDAPVVLLDEPSAALDPIAEHKIFEDFKKVSKNKSAVLISHRLSSITLCDKILVLEDGHIIEQGTHKKLLENNGRYAYLFNLQASKYYEIS